jgi:hypothetical protein
MQCDGGMICGAGFFLIFGEAEELFMQLITVYHISDILFVLVAPQVIVVGIAL